MTAAYLLLDKELKNTDEQEERDRHGIQTRDSADKNLSVFCKNRLNRIRSRLFRVGIACFLGTLAFYPFLYDALSLFPDSQALSLLQGLVIIIAFPVAICFSFYKNTFEQKEKQIFEWNQQDLRRASELAEFLNFIKENNGAVPPITDPVIKTKEEAGEWKVCGVEYGPVRHNLELILKGMTLAHSGNFAGLGLGTFTARQRALEGDLARAPHNIEGVLTLHSALDEVRVFLPGSGANAQWLQQMQAALMESALVPRGSHTHELLSAISFEGLFGQDPGRESLRHLILDQVRAGEDDKLPIRVRGYRILDGFIIATQLSVGHQPAVSLYQTGFFELFTGKIRSLGLVPQVYLSN